MAGAARVLGVASMVLIAAAPFAVEAASWGAASPRVVRAAAAAQVLAVIWLLGRRAGRYRVALAVAGAAGVAILSGVGLPARTIGLAVAGICHTAAYGELLAWFAASLRPGREPVVTGFARRMRRTMPDKVARYTRNVTWAWCVFFAAELALSAGLLAGAPLALWSSFVNLANLPAVAAMMLGEFAVRFVLFRHEPRMSLAATLAGLRNFRDARP